jgi:hypothetical protein
MPQCKEQNTLTSNLRKSASDLRLLALLQLAGPILVGRDLITMSLAREHVAGGRQTVITNVLECMYCNSRTDDARRRDNG